MDECGGQRVKAVSLHIFDCEGTVEAVVDDVDAGEGERSADLVSDARKDGHFQERALLIFDAREVDWLVRSDGMEWAQALAFGGGEPVAVRINHATIW